MEIGPEEILARRDQPLKKAYAGVIKVNTERIQSKFENKKNFVYARFFNRIAYNPTLFRKAECKEEKIPERLLNLADLLKRVFHDIDMTPCSEHTKDY